MARHVVSVSRLRELLGRGLTVGQAAARLGCSYWTAYEAARRAGIPRRPQGKRGCATPCTWEDCGEPAEVGLEIALTTPLPYCGEHASRVRELFFVTAEYAPGETRAVGTCSALTSRGKPCRRAVVRDGRCPSHPLESWRLEAAA